MNRRRLMMSQAVIGGGGGLPREYREVNYIEYNGANANAYFDINYGVAITDAHSRLEVDTEYTNLIAVNVNGNNTNGVRCVIGRDTARWYYGYASNNLYIDGLDTDLHTQFIDFAANKYGVDDTEYTQVSVTVNYSNFYLFARNVLGGSDNARRKYMRVHAARLYNDGRLDVNLVPCYRIADGIVGFYDTVNEVFYTPNENAADFIYG